MKHPREVLFEHHRSAGAKLDAIREDALAKLSMNRPGYGVPASAGNALHRLKPGLHASTGSWAQRAIIKLWNLSTDRAPVASSSLRALLRSLRWHLAGLSAAWVLAALLNADPAQTEARRMTTREAPPPRELLTALRENRRQIVELLESPATLSESVFEPPALVPKRRGGIQSTNAMA